MRRRSGRALESPERTLSVACRRGWLSAAEVATVLNESRDAVLKRLQRARRELLALWQEVAAEPAAGRRAAGGRS